MGVSTNEKNNDKNQVIISKKAIVNARVKAFLKFISTGRAKRYWLFVSLVTFTITGLLVDVTLFALSSSSIPNSAASTGNVGSGELPTTATPSVGVGSPRTNDTSSVTSRPPPATRAMNVPRVNSRHPIEEFFGQNVSTNTNPLFLVDGSSEGTFWRLTAFDYFESNGTWRKESDRKLTVIDKTIYGSYPSLGLTKNVSAEIFIQTSPNTQVESLLPIPWGYNQSSLEPTNFQFLGNAANEWNFTELFSNPYHDAKISVLSPFIPETSDESSSHVVKIKLKYTVTVPLKPLTEFVPSITVNASLIPDEILSRYLQRPTGTLITVLPLLTPILQDTSLDYWGRIVALRGNVTRKFTFDPNQAPNPRDDILSEMMTDPQKAYSSYDIATLTVLAARVLNIPARLVMGFRQTVSAETSPQYLSMNDLFFWPEVFIPNYGWLPLDVFNEPTYTLKAERIAGSSDRPFDVWNVSLLLNGQEALPNELFIIKEIVNGSTTPVGYATSNSRGFALLYFYYPDFDMGSHRFLISDLRERVQKIITVQVPAPTSYQGRLSPDPTIIKYSGQQQYKVTSDPGFISNGTDGIGWVLWNVTLTVNDTNPLNLTFQFNLTSEEGDFPNILVTIDDLTDNVTLKQFTYPRAPMSWFINDTESMGNGTHTLKVTLSYQSNAFGGRSVSFEKIFSNAFNIPRGGKIAINVSRNALLAGESLRINMSFFDPNGVRITNPSYVTDIRISDSSGNIIHQVASPFSNATYAFIMNTDPTWTPNTYYFTVTANILGSRISNGFHFTIIDPLSDPNNIAFTMTHNATTLGSLPNPVIFRGEQHLEIVATLTYQGKPIQNQEITLTDSNSIISLQGKTDEYGKATFVITFPQNYPEGNITITLTIQSNAGSLNNQTTITILDPYQIMIAPSGTSAIRSRTQLSFNITLWYHVTTPASGTVTIIDTTDNILIATLSVTASTTFNYTFPESSSLGSHEITFSFKNASKLVTIRVDPYQPSIHVVTATSQGIRGLDNATQVVYISQNGLPWTDPQSISEADVNVTFMSLTDNITLGHAITNSTGFAKFTFKIPSTWTIGTHSILIKAGVSNVTIQLTVLEGFDLALMINGTSYYSQITTYQIFEEKTINITTYVTFAGQIYTNASNPLSITMFINDTETSQANNILTYMKYYDHSQISLVYNYTFQVTTPAGQTLTRTIILSIKPHSWTLILSPTFTPTSRNPTTNTTTVYRNVTVLSWNVTVLLDNLPFTSGELTIELDGNVMNTTTTGQNGNAVFSHWFNATAPLTTYNLTVYLTNRPYVRHVEFIQLLPDYRFSFNDGNLQTNASLAVINDTIQLKVRMTRYDPNSGTFSRSVTATYWYYYKNATFTSSNITIIANANLTTLYPHDISITSPTFSNGTYTFYVFANSSTGILLYDSFTLDVFHVNYALSPTSLPETIIDYGDTFSQAFTLKYSNGTVVPNQVLYFRIVNANRSIHVGVLGFTTDAQGKFTFLLTTSTLPQGGKYYFYPFVNVTTAEGSRQVWNGTTFVYVLRIRQAQLSVVMFDVITSNVLQNGTSTIPRNVSILQINYTITLTDLTIQEAFPIPILWINDTQDARLNIAINLTRSGLSNTTTFNTLLDTPLGTHQLELTITNTNLASVLQFELISKFRINTALINGISSGTITMLQGETLNASVRMASFNMTAANQTYLSNPSLSYGDLLNNLTHYDVIVDANGTAQFTLAANQMNITVVKGNGTNTWTISPTTFQRGIYSVTSMRFYVKGQNQVATTFSLSLTIAIREPLRLNMTSVPTQVTWGEWWRVLGEIYNPLTNQTVFDGSFTVLVRSIDGNLKFTGTPTTNGLINISAIVNDNSGPSRNFKVILNADTAVFDNSSAIFEFTVSLRFSAALTTSNPSLVILRYHETQNISWQLKFAHNGTPIASQKLILQIVELNVNYTSTSNQTGWADFSIPWNLTVAYRSYTLKIIYEGNSTIGITSTTTSTTSTTVQGPVYLHNDYIAAMDGNNTRYVIRGKELMLWGRMLLANGTIAPLGSADVLLSSNSSATQNHEVITLTSGFYNITIRAGHWQDLSFIGRLVVEIDLLLLNTNGPYYVANNTQAVILSVAELDFTAKLNNISIMSSTTENKIANGSRIFFNITLSEINPLRSMNASIVDLLNVTAAWNGTSLGITRVNVSWNTTTINVSPQENIHYVLVINVTSPLTQTYYLNGTITLTFITKGALQLIIKDVPTRIQPNQQMTTLKAEIRFGGPNGELFTQAAKITIQVNRSDLNENIFKQTYNYGGSSFTIDPFTIPIDVKPGSQIIIKGEIDPNSIPPDLTIQETPSQYVLVVRDPSVTLTINTTAVTTAGNINYYFENTTLNISTTITFTNTNYTMANFSLSDWSLTYTVTDMQRSVTLTTFPNTHDLSISYKPPQDIGFLNISVTLTFQYGASGTTFKAFILVKMITSVQFAITKVVDPTNQASLLASENIVVVRRDENAITVELNATDLNLNELLKNVPLNTTVKISPTPKHFSISGWPSSTSSVGTFSFIISLTTNADLENFTLMVALANTNFNFTFTLVVRADISLTIATGNNSRPYYINNTQLYVTMTVTERGQSIPNITALLNNGTWNLQVKFYFDGQLLTSKILSKSNGDLFPTAFAITVDMLPADKTRGTLRIIATLEWDRGLNNTISSQEEIIVMNGAEYHAISLQPNTVQQLTQTVIALKRANSQQLVITANVTVVNDTSFALTGINVTMTYKDESNTLYRSTLTNNSGSFSFAVIMDFSVSLGNKSLSIWWQYNDTNAILLINYTIIVQSEVIFSKSIERTTFLETQMDGMELNDNQLAFIAPNDTLNLDSIPYIRFRLTVTDDNATLLTSTAGHGTYRFTITWNFLNGSTSSNSYDANLITSTGLYILKLNDPFPRSSAFIVIYAEFVPGNSYQNILLPSSTIIANITYYGEIQVKYIGRTAAPYDPNDAPNSSTNFVVEAQEPLIFWFEVRDEGFNMVLPANLTNSEFFLNVSMINDQTGSIIYQQFLKDDHLDSRYDGRFHVEYAEGSTGPRKIIAILTYNFTESNQVFSVPTTKLTVDFTLIPTNLSMFNVFIDNQTHQEIFVAMVGDVINITTYVSPLDKFSQLIPFPEVSNLGTVQFIFNTSIIINDTIKTTTVDVSTSRKISAATYVFSLIFRLESSDQPYTLSLTSKFHASSELKNFGYTDATSSPSHLRVHSNVSITLTSFGMFRKLFFKLGQSSAADTSTMLNSQGATPVIQTTFGGDLGLEGQLSDQDTPLAGYRIEITILDSNDTVIIKTVTYSNDFGGFSMDLPVTRDDFPNEGNYTITLRLTDFVNPPSLNVTLQIFIPISIHVMITPRYVVKGDQVIITGYLQDDLGNNLTTLNQIDAIKIKGQLVNISNGEFIYSHDVTEYETLTIDYLGNDQLFLAQGKTLMDLIPLTGPVIDVSFGPQTMITDSDLTRVQASISVYVKTGTIRLTKDYLSDRPLRLVLNGSVLWEGLLNGTTLTLTIDIRPISNQAGAYQISISGSNVAVTYHLQYVNGSSTSWQSINFTIQLLTTEKSPIAGFEQVITITPIDLNAQAIPLPITTYDSFPSVGAVIFASLMLMFLSFFGALVLVTEPWIRHQLMLRRQKKPMSELKKELSDLLTNLAESDKESEEEEEGADITSLLEWAIEEEQKEAMSGDDLDSLEKFSFELPPIFQEFLELLKLRQYPELIARILEEVLDLMRRRYNMYRRSETETIREWERRALKTPLGQEKQEYITLLYDVLSEGNYWPETVWTRQEAIQMFRAFVSLYPDLVDMHSLPEEQQRGISIVARVILKMGQIKQKDEFEEYL